MIQQNFQFSGFSLLPKTKNIVCLVDNTSIERAADLFFKIHGKLNFTLLNNSNFLLGTDLLRANIRRDLVQTVILTTEEKFLEVGQKYKNFPIMTNISKKKLFPGGSPYDGRFRGG